jgi:prevent-host-death family protein
VNIPVEDANARFSEILRRAEAGETIAITRCGKPIARIMPPADQEEFLPRIGALKGKIRIADDFDAPLLP